MMYKALCILLFCLPVVWLLPHLDQFAFQPAAQYSDMAVSHFPNGIYLQNTIHEYRSIPLWSGLILSGAPFVADPLSGLHYPLGWLAYLLPLPFGFHFVLMMHIVFGGVGVYWLLREEGLAPQAALLGGLVFEAMPKLYAHLGAGHLTLLYAVCLTPWLLFCEKHAWRNQLLRWILPGFILGLIALADMRWGAYSGLIWAAYSLREWFGRIPKMPIGRRLYVWIIERGANLLAAGMTAAPLLLPLIEFVQLSTRSRLTVAENTILSLPPGQLLSLVYPNLGGPAEWTLYPGAAILVLSVVVLLTRDARKRAGFWLGVIFITLFLSLGSNIPYLANFYTLPGLNLLRVPPRALFLTGIAFSITAGYALDSLNLALEGRCPPQKDPVNLVIFVITAFFTILAAAAWLVVSQPLPRIQFTWGALSLLLGGVVFFIVRVRKITRTWLFVLLTSACLIDLMGVNGLSLAFSPVSTVLAQGIEAVDFITHQTNIQKYRVYSPSYSLPQQTAAAGQLSLADGVNPMQIAAYADFMAAAAGVPAIGYSVTLPPFASGRPEIDNLHAIPDARKLGWLSVKYVVAGFPLDQSELQLERRFGSTWVYTNPFALPRAWVQTIGTRLGEEIVEVGQWNWEPNQIVVEAQGPGMLVLAEIFYPGWEVMIDGSPGKVIQAGECLRAAMLPEGKHHVVFSYRPRLFFIGLGLFSLAGLALITIVVWGRRAND